MDDNILGKVKVLTQMLSVGRANDYNLWREVGLCLHNLSDELLDNWKEFSRKSLNYKDGECEKMWSQMGFERDVKISLLILNRWAQIDNLDEYIKIVGISPRPPPDVARTVFSLYKYQYICTSIKRGIWYEFRNHRWSQNSYSFLEKIGHNVIHEYDRLIAYYSRLSLDQPTVIRKIYQEIIKNLNNVVAKLGTPKFVNNIMKECECLFYDSQFESKLNNNRDLVGFENGIYDLRIGGLRPGRQEDYISLSTGHNYVEFAENHEYVSAIETFMYQVFLDKTVKDYIYILLSSFLEGHNPNEKFHIFRGDGSNGQTSLLELVRLALGGYMTLFPVSFLTHRQKRSGLVEIEASRLKDSRLLVVSNGCDRAEKLNVTILKEWTGGDRISGLGSDGVAIDYKPQFKIVYQCHYWPRLPVDDEGVWRRVSLVEFESRFVENPDPQNPYEFKRDAGFGLKLDLWKQTFMFMLIEKYKIYRKHGLIEPTTVINATKEYRQYLKANPND